MYSLKFNGRFELNDPEEFLGEIQGLLKKYSVDYFGRIETQNLGDYVDFQKIEDPVIEDKKDE